MDEFVNHPILEVGSSHTQCVKGWLLFEQQNKHFTDLLPAIKPAIVSQNVLLLEFDPDKVNVDVRAWISTADMWMAEQPL